MHVIVIGAGIAGLSTAYALLRRGAHVTVVEQEPQSFSHSSGRNAAIFRPLETSPCIPKLAAQSRALLDELFQGDAWLAPRGLLLVAAAEASLKALAGIAAVEQLRCEALDADALVHMVPELENGRAQHGLWVSSAGVVDPHAIGTELERASKALGGQLRLRTRALDLRREGDRIVGVDLDGGALAADAVVLAAGAWSQEIAERARLPLALTPIRRHLALLENTPAMNPAQPTVWDVELETYFRPESGAVLASPCDETPWTAGVPPRDPAALELLGARLSQLAPALAEARVRTSWACLRTFAADRTLVVGPDPRAQGLCWIGGLGGFGMSTGVALGALAAARLAGDAPIWADALLPERLTQKGGATGTSAGLDFGTEERLT